MRRLGTATIVQLAFLFVDLDRDLPDEEFAGVEWCSDAFVSLSEALKHELFLDIAQDCMEKIDIEPKKTQPHWEPRRSASVLSPFIYLSPML